MPNKILLVEDDNPIARVYQEYLAGNNYNVSHVENGQAAIELLSADKFDLALVDLRLTDVDGFAILRHVFENQIPVEIVVMTGDGSMTNAIDAMKLGASDFLVKPFNKDRLLTTIENVLERQMLGREVQNYREEYDRHEYQGFIGSSLVMQGVYRVIESASQSKAAVFITGESGTGKEVCAEAIHRANNRSDKPFIVINCGAMPKDLIESEIFGHVKGAFTDAVSDRKGAAELADGGTLFLDEICELDINLQPKLLRFLQTGQIQPVGSNTVLNLDARIICATNRDPLKDVAIGRFREDLYYRLHVLPVQLPALRERDNDVIEIAQHLLSAYCLEENKSFSGFSPEVENVFKAYPWPGNIRQLQNVIRNIVALYDGGLIDETMLPAPLNGDLTHFSDTTAPAYQVAPPALPPSQVSVQSSSSMDKTFNIRPLAEMEFESINNALVACDGNVPKAAHFLGISAATIYRKKSAWKNHAPVILDPLYAEEDG